MLVPSFFAYALSTTLARAAVQRYTLNIVNSVIAPDGGDTRAAVLANGQLPGPVITANYGDTLQVKVVNQLTDINMAQGTSIHWHGLLQQRNAENDGVAWITQCPIAPGQDFTYNIPVQQSGTYWYHSHITTQYCDGLRGALVVYDPQDPLKQLYDVDDASTIITLGDWLHEFSPQGFKDFDLPRSTIINGLGRLTVNSSSPLTVVNVQSSKRYRFRILNTACLTAYNFSIDGHTMSVIETDGEETFPSLPFDILPIQPGQRISVVLNANESVGNYWIRAVPFFTSLFPLPPPTTEPGVNMAILRYSGAPNVEPTTNQTDFRFASEPTFIPLHPLTNISGTPDKSMVLNVGVVPGPRFAINGNTYNPPPLPVLLQILNGTDPYTLMPQGSIIPLPRHSLIEISIPGGSILSPHPFHLHGHKFGVVRSANTTFTNKFAPPIRDVVNTGGLTTDNVTIRFRTDNPGPWIFHCHVDFHLEAGLAVVFAEDTQGQLSGPQSQIITQNWKNLCPSWNALTSGKQYSLNDTS